MMRNLRHVLTAVAALGLAGPALAGPLSEAAETCSDPMTTGPEKLEVFRAYGWTPAEPEVDGNLLDLSTALIIGFTNGMPDTEERFGQAPVLAQNFAAMTELGQVTLWSKGDAVLAVSIAQTEAGTEHFACYFASPPTDDLIPMMESYGGPEDLPELEVIGTLFQEFAFNARDDRSYEMYSSWSRLTSDPPRTARTDGYRLERLEQPAD